MTGWRPWYRIALTLIVWDRLTFWSSIRPCRYRRMASALAAPVSTSSAVTRASTAATSLTRSGVRSRKDFTCSGLQAQDVPDAPDGVDQPRVGHVDLAPQVRDVGLDDAVVATEVVVPHVVEDLRLGQHQAGAEQQVPQQLE